MNETTVATAAAALWDAQADRVTIPPLTETFGAIDVDTAYEIQLVNIRRRLAEGDVIRGHKVGLSSEAMQQMLGVDEPDYGHLLESMFVADAGTIDVSMFLQPRAEIEVAFVLDRPLAGPGVTVDDVLLATDYVLPAIEIVDSRIVDWNVKLADTIADNASSGAVVLGGSPTKLDDIDVHLVNATLQSNGELRETGVSSAVLGNPAVAVAWLANKVAAFGISLEPGHVVMPGSCTRMIPVAAGDVIRADFDGLGHVSVAFQ